MKAIEHPANSATCSAPPIPGAAQSASAVTSAASADHTTTVVTVTISTAASRMASATHHHGEIPCNPSKAPIYRPSRAALAISAIPATEPIRLAASSGISTVLAFGLAAIARSASVYFCAMK